MTEDATVGWHHRVNGHEFEQILGDSEEKRSMLQSTHAVLQRVRHDLATNTFDYSSVQSLSRVRLFATP